LQKILKKFLRNLNGPFLTFLPTFFELAIKVKQKSFRGKSTFLPPTGFQNGL